MALKTFFVIIVVVSEVIWRAVLHCPIKSMLGKKTSLALSNTVHPRNTEAQLSSLCTERKPWTVAMDRLNCLY